MNVKELRFYMTACKIHNIKPTWKGLKRFKKGIKR